MDKGRAVPRGAALFASLNDRYDMFTLPIRAVVFLSGLVVAHSSAAAQGDEELFSKEGYYFCGSMFDKITNIARGSVDSVYKSDKSWLVSITRGDKSVVEKNHPYEKRELYKYKYCVVFDNLADAEKLHSKEAARAKKFESTQDLSNLVQASNRHTIRAPWQNSLQGRPGYQSADISLAYQFLSCSDEIVMAYAIDPKSVEVGPMYWPAKSGRSVPTDGAKVPEPSAVILSGFVKVRTDRLHLNPGSTPWSKKVYDEFAGPSLGFGCLTGQTQSLGKTADLVGPKAKPEQIKEFLDALVLTDARVGDGPLQNAALDSSVRDPEADRLAREKAEAERIAAEKAAAKELKRRWAEHEERSKAIFAKAAAERKAYEDKVAAKKAADEKYARDLAKFQAETKRVEAANAEYERKMKEYREAIANGAVPAQPNSPR